MEEAPKPHIAILPTPGIGHLIPFTELARKLVHLHNFTITFIFPHDGPILQTSPHINSIFLPPPVTDHHFPKDTPVETRIVLTLTRSTQSLCHTLSQLNESAPLSAAVFDLFWSITFEAVNELTIPLYIFFTCSSMMLSLTFQMPELDKSCTCEFRDLPGPVQLPGCVPLHASDLTDVSRNRTSETYKLCLEMCRNFTLAKGILINSFHALEPGAIDAFGKGGWPPVYPVGPLTRPGSGEGKAGCLKWLDEQEAGSVLFVSFGSGGTLSSQQVKELSMGLEVSGHKFVLVSRRHNDNVRNGAYFDEDSRNTASAFERIEGNGFIVSDWAPQVEILSHPSTGGFLTHCGWNSILESVIHCVPLIAWPLFAEQRMNAVLVSECLKVGFRVREDEEGVVGSEQISGLVRRLMGGGEEGEELRRRMRNLKEAAARALSQDGSSTKSLASVAEIWNPKNVCVKGEELKMHGSNFINGKKTALNEEVKMPSTEKLTLVEDKDGSEAGVEHPIAKEK